MQKSWDRSNRGTLFIVNDTGNIEVFKAVYNFKETHAFTDNLTFELLPAHHWISKIIGE